MEVVKLIVAWGSSPETDDSAIAYLLVRGRTIVKEFRWFGGLRYYLTSMPRREVYLGHGYDKKQLFDSVLEDGALREWMV